MQNVLDLILMRLFVWLTKNKSSLRIFHIFCVCALNVFNDEERITSFSTMINRYLVYNSIFVLLRPLKLLFGALQVVSLYFEYFHYWRCCWFFVFLLQMAEQILNLDNKFNNKIILTKSAFSRQPKSLIWKHTEHIFWHNH